MDIKENEYMLFLFVLLLLVGFSVNMAKTMKRYKLFQNVAGIVFVLLLAVYYYYFGFYQLLYAFLVYSVLVYVFSMGFLSLKYYRDIKKYNVTYSGFKEMHRSFIFSPPERKKDKINLDPEGIDIKFILPEENVENSSGMLTRRSEPTSTYEKKNDLSFDGKVLLVRSWKFFRLYEKNSIAEVTFEVSVQKITEYTPLNEKLNIYAAAYHYLAAKYGDTEAGFTFKNNDSDAEPVFRNVKVNDFCFLQYEVGLEYSVHNMISHIPVNNNLMLTIEVRHTCYDKYELLNNIVVAFSKKILSDMNLDIKPISYKNKCGSHLNLPVPPDIKNNDHSLPDKEEYRLMLRNNAKDPLQWFLFEHSGVFYSWFSDQFDKLENASKKTGIYHIENTIKGYISDISACNASAEGE